MTYSVGGFGAAPASGYGGSVGGAGNGQGCWVGAGVGIAVGAGVGARGVGVDGTADGVGVSAGSSVGVLAGVASSEGGTKSLEPDGKGGVVGNGRGKFRTWARDNGCGVDVAAGSPVLVDEGEGDGDSDGLAFGVFAEWASSRVATAVGVSTGSVGREAPAPELM